MSLKIVCLDADTLGTDADLGAIKRLGETMIYGKTPADQVIERLQNADVAVTNKVVIDASVMAKTSLKLICVTATGTNNIDLIEAQKRGIAVKNVAGYSTDSVAQQTFATLLSLINQTQYYDQYCKRRDGWASSEIFVHLNRPFKELAGKRFAVVGLGEIGKKVAHIARAFGCEVCYYSTSGQNSSDEFDRIDLKGLASCDIITIHAPLNDATKNLFDYKLLRSLRSGVVIVNMARGGIVDESAAAELVDLGQLKYGADVALKEPMASDSPFLSVVNRAHLLITPHIAWASVEARRRLLDATVQNIKDFIAKNKEQR